MSRLPLHLLVLGAALYGLPGVSDALATDPLDLTKWWGEHIVRSSPGNVDNKECHQDCTKKGNCNKEWGWCECPFGFRGPACDEPILPACQARPEDHPFIGVFIPKSCECYRQAMAFFGCKHPDFRHTCEYSLFQFRLAEVHCWEVEGKPASEQWSDFPAANATGLVWKKFNMDKNVFEPADEGRARKAINLWGHPCTANPLDMCPSQCHRQGFCLSDCHSDGRDPWCECHKGWVGDQCEKSEEDLCWNECSRRGKCVRGFCHCEPGYFGADCSRSEAYEPQPERTPDWKRPRIYVYDLPHWVSAPLGLDDNLPDVVEIYSSFDWFFKLLLKDEAVRTMNPWEANLFAVPAHVYSYSSNVQSPGPHMARVAKYLNETYPFWRRYDGRDHFIVVPGDRGTCYVTAETRNMIKMVHFGYHLDQNRLRSVLNPAPVDERDSCLNPVRDLVIPPHNHLGGTSAAGVYSEIVAQNGSAPLRTNLLFFAGGVRSHDPTYSGGVRQQVHELLQRVKAESTGDENSDIVFIEGSTPDYAKLYETTKFCLSPHGSGFGIRVSIAMAHGCIPVIIQDHVFQPLEGELPYELFSVRIAKRDIPDLIPILRSVTEEELASMRLAMARYYQAFLWEPEFGGLAYNWTIQGLFTRVQSYRGEIYRRLNRKLQEGLPLLQGAAPGRPAV